MMRLSPLLALSLFVPLAGCSNVAAKAHNSVAWYGSTPALMVQYGCPTCHVIPGVPGAVGKVGPSLDELAQRSYIAGTLPNSPGNLQQWIMHPQSIRPGTAMPEMGVSGQDSQRIAAFLEAIH